MPLAEWSGKAAVEDEKNMGFAAKIGQAYRIALEISQGEIGCGGIE
jgi:hypothetical protein